MQIFDGLTAEQENMLYAHVIRASGFLIVFLLGLIGRIAVSWISKVNGYSDRITRVETICDERKGSKVNRGKK